MKKTAVEWLIEQLMPKVLTAEQYYHIEKAKEMEKEQIVEAHGNKLKKSKDTGNYEYWFSGEDYYTKTFKNEPK
jgi:hypothetical protein